MNFTWITLMILSAVGLAFSRKKYKQGVTWGKSATVVCGILVLFFALLNLFGGGGPGAQKLRNIEQTYRRVAGEKLGSYLADQQNFSKALLLVKPGTEDHARTQKMIEGVREGLGREVELVNVVRPDIPEKVLERYRERMTQSGEPPSEMESEQPESSDLDIQRMMQSIPLGTWFNADRLDKTLKPYKGRCDVVIFGMSLPSDIGASKILTAPDSPPIAILWGESRFGEYEQAIKEGDITAAVARNPQSRIETEKMPPGNLDKAFAKRYLLITPDTIDEIAEKHEELFQ